jgi:hypothetical protein
MILRLNKKKIGFWEWGDMGGFGLAENWGLKGF